MQSNWSLILNILLLMGVIAAIVRVMRARKSHFSADLYQASADKNKASSPEYSSYNDDIIAVRKLNGEPSITELHDNDTDAFILQSSSAKSASPKLMVQEEFNFEETEEAKVAATPSKETARTLTPSSLMLFLVAKGNRQFAGYELLQTVLAAGLRFGEGNLFYRHQNPNGQGPVLCGLAAATQSGVFDLQNIGAFSAKGLCLFMHASKNPTIDAERFAVMLETAKQLSEGLDANILDDQRRPLNDAGIANYYQQLNIKRPELAII